METLSERSSDEEQEKASQKEAQPRPVKIKLTYPWLSALLALLTLGYLLISSDPSLASYYHLPKYLFSAQFKYALGLVLASSILWDCRQFYLKKQRHQQDIEQFNQQVREVWQSKKALQIKAHTFAGHADKLKLFISDKLLEYIEYDEKFLHFKNIAAEVRHNGVICYDKVRTVLERSIAKVEEGSEEALTQRGELQTAVDSMRYLWDLLDLSTTDNIAMHIADHLCECEEHYYRTILNDQTLDEVPYSPVFKPQMVVYHLLAPMLESAPPPLADYEGQAVSFNKDPQFRVLLNPVSSLLGNPNHLMLMLENLVKNAQFFANKRQYQQKHMRIAVWLTEKNGQVIFSIYNRGPHIDEDQKDQIYQLGYSTRRVQEHHGKGLGLYFVHEIVKAYEGRIRFANIVNPGNLYSIRVQLNSGQVSTEVVKVVVLDGKPRCQLVDSKESERFLQWSFNSAIKTVEVSIQDNHHTHMFDEFNRDRTEVHLDPAHAYIPKWAVEVSNKRRSSKLVFMPLDISGVQFQVRLPTADARLDGVESSMETDIDEDVERLSGLFKAFDVG